MKWTDWCRKGGLTNHLVPTWDYGVRSAGVLRDGRVVFNIAGNKYRVVVCINYPYRFVYIRFVGTHRQYDTIDAQII
jgi:mRNA-degrading endonuclease HigB of HigAB toxin-antitoxin module